MIAVEIPVHPLSRKIILKEYGSEPIDIGKRDLLYQQIHYIDRSVNPEYGRRLLRDSIVISVGNNQGKAIRENYAAGYHLFHFHVDRLINYMAASFLAGQPAFEAMLEFYRLFDIDDNDFKTDRAYKRWQRWKKSKKCYLSKGLYWQNRPHSVLPPVHEKLAFPFTPEQISDFVHIAADEFRKYLFYQNGKFNPHMIKKLILYAFSRLGDMTSDEICRKFRIPSSTVRHHIASFQNILNTEPDFENCWNTAKRKLYQYGQS